ncbi:GPI-anchored wall transfer protein 1 [Aaosphaeria arxii CBS 175.79]|uniref:GPI-anchored wall transfer protein n=1 Tax=Aaosphaeria arxii CBS 175.79 TaxID=1450172 RepID=A0A6A5XYH7_9PLEO|nr:GPI-anchored wall transfer protein 1 [Aaosphaeria arxii CBS 175.79]KAF2017887.1 GPI-anchored wall transfer protein 1 [Aaosphaeria arxii CBS 175.79]
MVKYDKAAKIQHVSGLTGSSVADINAVSLAMPLTILLWSVLQSRTRAFIPYTLGPMAVDFLLNCGAILFSTTIYSSTPWVLNILLLLPAIFITMTEHGTPPQRSARPQPKNPTPLDRLPIKPFITHYRGAMMVITCIAILAVDFRVFPRRFGKVENWGTSLMDVGVGSFVFTSGVVSVRSFLKEDNNRRPSLSRRFMGSLRHSIPLLVLGVLRLISVKGLDYAEHVTEYGVHWNFFFTLGFLPPFVSLFQSAFQLVPSYAVLSCMLSALHELALDKTDLGAYILTAPRTDLISMNREGIFSFFGYLAIFLAGQSLGSFALPRESSLPPNASRIEYLKKSIMGKLAVSSLAWITLFYFSISYYGLGLSVSRRLANFPYFLWTCAFNSSQIAICYAIESYYFPSLRKASSKEDENQRAKDATSPLLFAFNRNGLAVFLAANLLTGLVNLTIPTLDFGKLESMAVLIVYMATVSGLALGLDRLDVSIKL